MGGSGDAHGMGGRWGTGRACSITPVKGDWGGDAIEKHFSHLEGLVLFGCVDLCEHSFAQEAHES